MKNHLEVSSIFGEEPGLLCATPVEHQVTCDLVVRGLHTPSVTNADGSSSRRVRLHCTT